MECSCVYGYYDGDECATMLREKEVKARKNYNCMECGDVIDIGNRYFLEVYVWDGKCTNHRTCLACKSIRDEFFCEGWSYGGIMENLKDHIIGVGIDDLCLGKGILNLIPAAKEKITRIFENISGEK